jgi:hypothetical protein
MQVPDGRRARQCDHEVRKLTLEKGPTDDWRPAKARPRGGPASLRGRGTALRASGRRARPGSGPLPRGRHPFPRAEVPRGAAHAWAALGHLREADSGWRNWGTVASGDHSHRRPPPEDLNAIRMPRIDRFEHFWQPSGRESAPLCYPPVAPSGQMQQCRPTSRAKSWPTWPATPSARLSKRPGKGSSASVERGGCRIRSCDALASRWHDPAVPTTRTPLGREQGRAGERSRDALAVSRLRGALTEG